MTQITSPLEIYKEIQSIYYDAHNDYYIENPKDWSRLLDSLRVHLRQDDSCPKCIRLRESRYKVDRELLNLIQHTFTMIGYKMPMTKVREFINEYLPK